MEQINFWHKIKIAFGGTYYEKETDTTYWYRGKLRSWIGWTLYDINKWFLMKYYSFRIWLLKTFYKA